jgi:hypothetical protein
MDWLKAVVGHVIVEGEAIRYSGYDQENKLSRGGVENALTSTGK